MFIYNRTGYNVNYDQGTSAQPSLQVQESTVGPGPFAARPTRPVAPAGKRNETLWRAAPLTKATFSWVTRPGRRAFSFRVFSKFAQSVFDPYAPDDTWVGGGRSRVQKVSIQLANSITLSHKGSSSVTVGFAATTRGWSRIFNVPEDLPQPHFSDFESVGRWFESPRAHQRIL